jgi:hypothetical protein
MSEGPLTNPAIQKRLKALDLRTTAIEAADLDAIMRSEAGRRFMYRMVFRIGLLQARSFDSSGQMMAFNEGRRAMALLLLAETQAVCPELWMVMLKERIALEEATQEAREEAAKPHGEDE